MITEGRNRIVYDKLPSIEVIKHKNTFKLVTPIEWWGISIPAGFTCNGASVPRIIRKLLIPKSDFSAMFALIFLDFVYLNHPVGWNRKEADEEFQFLLEAGNVPLLCSVLAYFCVRLFSGSAWNGGK